MEQSIPYDICYRREKDEVFAIETDRLRLSVLKKNAAEKVNDYYCRNRAFHKRWAQTQPDSYFTVKIQKEYLKSDVSMFYNDRMLPLYIFEKNDHDRVIGRISLFNIVRGGMQSAAIGYHQDEDFCGKGFMSEAIRAVAKFRFDELKLHRIEAFILPENERSINLVRKAGFKEEGLRFSYMHINGRWEDHIGFALFAENLQEMKK